MPKKKLKMIWKNKSLDLQCSTVPSPLEKEMKDEVLTTKTKSCFNTLFQKSP
jgi:hypothetical protein